MKEDFKTKPLPKFEDVKDGIEELLHFDKWDRYKIRSSPKKFEKRFDELFTSRIQILPSIIMLANSDTLPFKFYRLRKSNKTFNETLISGYSYPPNRIVKSIQRANIPYHPVFYCSDNAFTAIFETIKSEININPKAEYYLSEWQLQANKKVNVSPFLFGNNEKSNPYNVLSDSTFTKLKNILKEYSEDEIKSFESVLILLSNLFRKDETYVVSSYLAHRYLYASHNFRTDIFIYPSSQTNWKTVNFAIHPNTVTEKLKLTRVFKLKVTQFSKEEFSTSVNISHIGKNKEGIIYWQRMEKETEEGEKLRKEIDELFFINN